MDAPKLAEPLVKWSHEPARPQDIRQSLSKGILLATAAPAGPGIDTAAGWDGAVRLADKLSLPVWVAPSPVRCPFPTRHPSFRGILPAGTELWAVTADPDEAARAPFGHILIGDPVDAIERLADTMPDAGRPPLPAREPLPQADTAGPAFTWEAILDAVNAAKTDDTVIAHEWTSADVKWDRLEFTRPGSLYWATARCSTRSAGCGPPPSTTSRWSSSSRATANTGR